MDYSNLKDLGEMLPEDATASIELLSTYDPDGEKNIRDPYFVSYDIIKPSWPLKQ